MRCVLLVLLATLLGGLATGCQGEEELDWLGVRRMRTIPVEQARVWLRHGRAQAVQRSAPDERLPALSDASRLRPDDPVPGSLVEAGKPVLVIATERDDALSLAARLARAGVADVRVVTGERKALVGLQTARRAALRSGDARLQPSGTNGHPTDRATP